MFPDRKFVNGTASGPNGVQDWDGMTHKKVTKSMTDGLEVVAFAEEKAADCL